MKRVLFSALLLLLAQSSSYAINWVQVTTPLNRVAYLDSDSITEYKSYYFYNIKFQNPNESNYTILTMQSSKSSPLSARLRAYTEEEYKALNGDYQNITNNLKTTLEPVTFESVVNTCYKQVKLIKSLQARETLTFEDEIIED